MFKRLFVITGVLLSTTAVSADSMRSAAKRGDLNAIKTMLEKGISVNQLDPDDWRETPPLLAAIKNEHTAVAQYLIAQNADCEAVDFAEKSALTYAAQFNQVELIPALVACGADLEHIGIDASNRTPLVWAVIKRHEAVAMALVRHGAKTQVEWVHPVNDTRHELMNTIKEYGMDELLLLAKSSTAAD